MGLFASCSRKERRRRKEEREKNEFWENTANLIPLKFFNGEVRKMDLSTEEFEKFKFNHDIVSAVTMRKPTLPSETTKASGKPFKLILHAFVYDVTRAREALEIQEAEAASWLVLVAT